MTDPRLDDQLRREILRGQHLRATILACVLAAVAAVLALMVVLDDSVVGRSVVPPVVPGLPLLLAAHQVVLRWHIGRGLSGAVRVPEWFWYANTLVEVTSVTVIVAVVGALLESPVHAVLTPPVYLYFVFIILSTLRLDFRTSLFTGAVAGSELVAVYVVLDRVSVGTPASEPLLDSPIPYVMKGVVLLASGLAAGFVARELRERIFGAVVAAARRERSAAFLASMSHEIRTPLNAVVGYAELLERDGDLGEEHRHAVATMKSSGDHLLGVVNQVLDLSRIEAGREELAARDFDLADLAAELTRMFELPCRRNGVAWRATVDPASAWVRGDAVRLRQVLINLAGNAIRFTESGQVELEIRALPRPTPPADDGIRARTREYRFEVRDTGAGIAPEDQSRVFEAFRTDDAGGTGRGSGLGLAIAYAQVRLMGGRLDLESSPGRGSRFFFTLPMEPGDPDLADAAPEGVVVAARGAGGETVVAVVADASPVTRELLARMLRRIGVDAREAASAAEVREVVAAASPAIVFLDPSLLAEPGDDDALDELVAPARAVGPRPRSRPRLAAVSSSVLEHERRAALASGFDAFLARPVSMERLYACLEETPGVVLERVPVPEPVGAGGPGSPPWEDASGEMVERLVGSLPPSLWRSLREAAGDYNVTDLRKQLARLDELGEDARPLAARLRRLTRSYDLEAVRELLDRVPHG